MSGLMLAPPAPGTPALPEAAAVPPPVLTPRGGFQAQPSSELHPDPTVPPWAEEAGAQRFNLLCLRPHPRVTWPQDSQQPGPREGPADDGTGNRGAETARGGDGPEGFPGNAAPSDLDME